jgi:hypothetical protein
MNIEPNKMYSPRDIADNGFILNSKGKPDYLFVLKLIRREVLPASDYTFGSRVPHYMVAGRDIVNYKRQYEGYQNGEN